MSTEMKDDGGPAFPVSVPTDFQFANDGMTLRDYFAGQVIAWVLRNPLSSTEADARRAYAVADAMLSARKQEPTP